MRFRIFLPVTIGLSILRLLRSPVVRTGAPMKALFQMCEKHTVTLSSGQLSALSQCAGFSTDVPDSLSSQKSFATHQHERSMSACHTLRLSMSHAPKQRHPSVKSQPTRTFVRMIIDMLLVRLESPKARALNIDASVKRPKVN